MDGIITPEDLSDFPAMSCCIYGDPGSGKTTMLGTLENPLILYTDKNRVALYRLKKHFKFIETFQELQATQFEITTELENGTFPYTSVAIDSWTDTEQMIKKLANPNREPSLQDWGKTIVPVWRDCMLGFLDFTNPDRYESPIDVVFTARVHFMKFEGGDARMWGLPNVPGQKLPEEVFGWPDEVFHLRVEESVNAQNEAEVKHVARTASDSTYVAKDGSDALDLEEVCDFGVIKQKISNYLNQQAA